jgi:antitoxin component YwqK of YwqJK toxin-antitoxin module
MKRLITIMLVIISNCVYAQKLPDMGLYKVRITENDKTVLAEIDPVSSNPRAKQSLMYYWYSANMIHSTQGGFSGKLLNGQYEEFYLNKNLKQQGTFKKGLKDGAWKTWGENGMLLETSTWKNGVLVTGPPPSLWKRINIFKKKTHSAADSAAKPK